MEYKNKLQHIYDIGKENQDVDLSGDDAEAIMSFLKVDFGEFSDEIETALEGMTGIEAFLYLNELTSTLDKADGSLDGNIESNINIKDAFSDAGMGESQNDIEDNLIHAANEFKEDDDAPDAEKIAFLQSTKGNTSPDAGVASDDIADFTATLGTTDWMGNSFLMPSIEKTQNDTEATKKTFEMLNATLTGLMQLISSITPMMRSISKIQKNNIPSQESTIKTLMAKLDKLRDIQKSQASRISSR